ncbi:alkaline phosphatase family protein [Streptomyces sp. Je 1-79]|uniref:alkaline phosphatase D family protein n=1 Tax=Streptomyces sp. Je 1-79 TaxID=2943847 RepID=UPI0021A4F7F0|nr:alkaline phosphatase D family protein [Streptomyces sp. Je 1-79]MCT4352900.1 alkaline phosphatase family protein [Streptomyces sp. Je 1-79]
MAAGLRLGPVLRYVDGVTGGSATIWVETDRPCTAEVRGASGAGGSTRTFQIAGHHYALIPVTGLSPGTTTEYEVRLDGRTVWPPPDSRFPPSTIRTPSPDGEVRVAFGSCRWAAKPAEGRDPVGPDALDTLAKHLATRLATDGTNGLANGLVTDHASGLATGVATDRANDRVKGLATDRATDPPRTPPGAAAEEIPERPDVLVLLGDQVYADETSADTRRWLAARRDPRDPPGSEVGEYEEYTRLYDESWGDPEVRWLLSTVPSCMIFDDHDVIDDWNTSAAWLARMRATPWWRERVLSGLMSYWVYQHLGNLSPAELATDPLYAEIRSLPDGTDRLRRFAAEADADPACVRWSYRRDFGRTRLLMIDTRAARLLKEDARAMLDPDEAAWVREQALSDRGAYDHLLVGTSLPWLLPPLIHDAEAWNAALCRGERGGPEGRWARFAEDLRQRADLEHWAAFPSSFEWLTRLLAEAGTGQDAPATVCVLSGDVHHAYVAEPRWPDEQPDARVVQLTCSPLHNAIPLSVRLGFRFGWSRAGNRLGRALARHARVGRPSIDWRRTGGPWFGNQLMTLTLHARSARLTLAQARRDGRLKTVDERRLDRS